MSTNIKIFSNKYFLVLILEKKANGTCICYIQYRCKLKLFFYLFYFILRSFLDNNPQSNPLRKIRNDLQKNNNKIIKRKPIKLIKRYKF